MPLFEPPTHVHTSGFPGGWEHFVPEAEPLWLFAYGSLMWNPEFEFASRHVGLLRGYHRSLCISSHRYRGTPDRPGLVLGLARGGACRGVAFEISPEHARAALPRIWAREMLNRTYHPKRVSIVLADRHVRALAFVADSRHQQFAGRCEIIEAARRVAHCHGERGSNLDYLKHTVAELRHLGVRDRGLEAVFHLAQRFIAEAHAAPVTHGLSLQTA